MKNSWTHVKYVFNTIDSRILWPFFSRSWRRLIRAICALFTNVALSQTITWRDMTSSGWRHMISNREPWKHPGLCRRPHTRMCTCRSTYILYSEEIEEIRRKIDRNIRITQTEEIEAGSELWRPDSESRCVYFESAERAIIERPCELTQQIHECHGSASSAGIQGILVCKRNAHFVCSGKFCVKYLRIFLLVGIAWLSLMVEVWEIFGFYCTFGLKAISIKYLSHIICGDVRSRSSKNH